MILNCKGLYARKEDKKIKEWDLYLTYMEIGVFMHFFARVKSCMKRIVSWIESESECVSSDVSCTKVKVSLVNASGNESILVESRKWISAIKV